MKKDKEQLMNCDIESGMCEITEVHEKHKETLPAKPVRLLYFTDPICSSCWGIEPQLRKLKQEYGDYFDIEYRMGGLLKSWEEYGGSDVNGPASVAQHWDEASVYYNMPIDGDVWIEDPLSSSYPPSIAFKAAQLQDTNKAAHFLRRIKEMVFIEKKNITKWEHLAQAAADAGLDAIVFKDDYENKAMKAFDEDLLLARELGVRGFPTIFFTDEEDNRFKVYGSKPYELYEDALLKLLPAATKNTAPLSYETVLNKYDTLTSKEFSVLTNISLPDAEAILISLEEKKQIGRVITRNGSLWKKIV